MTHMKGWGLGLLLPRGGLAIMPRCRWFRKMARHHLVSAISGFGRWPRHRKPSCGKRPRRLLSTATATRKREDRSRALTTVAGWV